MTLELPRNVPGAHPTHAENPSSLIPLCPSGHAADFTEPGGQNLHAAIDRCARNARQNLSPCVLHGWPSRSAGSEHTSLAVPPCRARALPGSCKRIPHYRGGWRRNRQGSSSLGGTRTCCRPCTVTQVGRCAAHPARPCSTRAGLWTGLLHRRTPRRPRCTWFVPCELETKQTRGWNRSPGRPG